MAARLSTPRFRALSPKYAASFTALIMAIASAKAGRTFGGVYLAFTGTHVIHAIGPLVCGLASLWAYQHITFSQ